MSGCRKCGRGNEPRRRMRDGIPDPWLEYLACMERERGRGPEKADEVCEDFRLSRDYVRFTKYVWKERGLSLAQGIPDPWRVEKLCDCEVEIPCKEKRHRKKSKTRKKQTKDKIKGTKEKCAKKENFEEEQEEPRDRGKKKLNTFDNIQHRLTAMKKEFRARQAEKESKLQEMEKSVGRRERRKPKSTKSKSKSPPDDEQRTGRCPVSGPARLPGLASSPKPAQRPLLKSAPKMPHRDRSRDSAAREAPSSSSESLERLVEPREPSADSSGSDSPDPDHPSPAAPAFAAEELRRTLERIDGRIEITRSALGAEDEPGGPRACGRELPCPHRLRGAGGSEIGGRRLVVSARRRPGRRASCDGPWLEAIALERRREIEAANELCRRLGEQLAEQGEAERTGGAGAGCAREPRRRRRADEEPLLVESLSGGE